MPRVSASNPPKDPNKFQEWVGKALASGISRGVELILSLEIKRPLNSVNPSTIRLGTSNAKIAAAWQRAGSENETKCLQCQSDGQPFVECVGAALSVQDTYHMNTRCANCFYKGISCSLSKPLGRLERATSGTIEIENTVSFINSHSPPSRKVKEPPKKKVCMSYADKMPRREARLTGLESFHSASPLAQITSGDDNFLILGDLKLPNPETCGLGELHLDLVRSMKTKLIALNQRNHASIDKVLIDPSKAFRDFAVREIAEWKRLGNNAQEHDKLVRCSGSLEAPIALHLHQPSNTTERLDFGETFDMTNGCIRLLQRCGFDDANSLWLDHLYRRDAHSRGVKEYPESILAEHESLTWDLMASTEAKIEILFGVHVQNRVLGDPRVKFVAVPLWGAYAGIILVALCETTFKNAQPEHYFRRLILLSPHPQAFFYAPADSPTLLRQEAMMQAVEKMTCGHVKLAPGYWSSRQWRHDKENLALLKTIFGKKGQDDDDGALLSVQGDYFSSSTRPVTKTQVKESDLPPSNDELRKLLPCVLAAAAAATQTDSDWSNPEEIPESVLHWWNRVSKIFFNDVDNVMIDESPARLTELFSTTPISNLFHVEMTVLHCLHRLMEHQHSVLRDENLGGRIRKNQDLWYSEFLGREIPLKCQRCDSPIAKPDKHPRWSIRCPGCYVSSESRCYSESCSDKPRVTGLPRDENIPTVATVTSWDIGKPQLDLTPFVLSDVQIAEKALPSIVETWCSKCGTKSADHTPSFTRGEKNPLYVIKRHKCKNNNSGGYFIPMDSELKYIFRRQLGDYMKLWAHSGDVIIDHVLQHLPASTTKSELISDKQ